MHGQDGQGQIVRQGAVAAGHEVTVSAAVEILATGGNAVDAALAACFAACVVEPVLASIGGGGFATIRTDEDHQVFDFFAQTPRRRAPKSDEAFFEIEADFGETTQAFHIGVGAAATPGFVPGLYALWSRHGSLPMSEIVAPAVQAAREGVAVNEYQAYLLGVVSPIYRHDPASRRIFGGASRHSLLATGEILQNPELADVFEHIAEVGVSTVIEGDLASRMIDCCRAHGGHLGAEDFATYAVHEREPLIVEHAGARLFTNPPPSSGGVLIAFALAMIDALPIGGPSGPSLADWAAVLDVTRRARMSVSGDLPDALAELLDPDTRRAFAASLTENPLAPRGTTHISVIDRNDMAVAVTLSNGEGCGVIIPGCGFMLNNMLGEEDINPGGLGRWQENRRMASMMAPSILEQADGGLTALGSGGSNRIRTAMTQVINRLNRPGSTLEDSIAAPRSHVEGETFFFEDPDGQDVDRANVSARSDVIDFKPFRAPSMFFGGVHAVRRLPDGSIEAAGDPRRAGCAHVVDA